MVEKYRPQPEPPKKKRVGTLGKIAFGVGAMLAGERGVDSASIEAHQGKVVETHSDTTLNKGLSEEELKRRAADIFEGAEILDEKNDAEK